MVGSFVAVVVPYLTPARPSSVADTAAALTRAHKQPAAGPASPVRRQIIEAVRRGQRAGIVTVGEARKLQTLAVEAWLDLVVDPGPLGWGVVHHDAHVGNVLVDHTRTARLIDFETTGVAPRICDLAPLVVYTRRYEEPETSLEEFSDVYRFAASPVELQGPSLAAAVMLYETWVAAWGIHFAAAVDSAALPEARLRVESLLSPRFTDQPWTFL